MYKRTSVHDCWSNILIFNRYFYIFANCTELLPTPKRDIYKHNKYWERVLYKSKLLLLFLSYYGKFKWKYNGNVKFIHQKNCNYNYDSLTESNWVNKYNVYYAW